MSDNTYAQKLRRHADGTEEVSKDELLEHLQHGCWVARSTLNGTASLRDSQGRFITTVASKVFREAYGSLRENNTRFSYAERRKFCAPGDTVIVFGLAHEKPLAPAPQYRVGLNTCSCHPETCSCNDYAIYSVATKEKHSTHFHKHVAEQLCDALNRKAEKGLKDHQIAILVNDIDAELHACLDGLLAHRELPQCTRAIISRAVVRSLTEQGLRADEH